MAGLNPMTGVLIRGKFGHGHTYRGEYHVKMEVEVGVMHPQAKEHHDCRHPPEARREAWNRFSLQASRGTNPATSGFLTFGL